MCQCTAPKLASMPVVMLWMLITTLWYLKWGTSEQITYYVSALLLCTDIICACS